MTSHMLRPINHEIDFAWQAQFLVKLECHFSWQAQHFVEFCEIARERNDVVFFHTKCVSKTGRVRSPKWRVRGDDFIFGSWSNRLCIGGSNSRTFRSNLELRLSWQVKYLVRLEGDSCRSALCK